MIPDKGKPYSFIYKITGNEEFFIPEIAQIQRSPNQTGWWFMLGGAEYVMPDEEHGETWAAPWKWEITENSPERKSVKMSVDELQFGLKESIVISVFPGKAYYQAEISITNPTDSTVRFQHWINPMWVPGGDKNGLTPNTEFIIPAEEVYVTERTFNKWMLKFSPGNERLQAYDSSPMRFFKNWEYYGDLLALKLENGYYSAFSHEKNEGIVRVFPFETNPGCNIWTFGFNPDTAVRKRFSGTTTHNGYVEMWGGITPGFKEFYSLEPGTTISWVEWMYPYSNTSGLHYANRDFAVTFHRTGKEKYRVNFCPSGLIKDIDLEVKSPSTGRSYLNVRFKSTFPEINNEGFDFVSTDTDIELLISAKGEELIRLKPGDQAASY